MNHNLIAGKAACDGLEVSMGLHTSRMEEGEGASTVRPTLHVVLRALTREKPNFEA